MSSSASPPPFAQTLNAITQIKFNQLAHKNAAFNPHLAAVRSIISDPTIPEQEKVQRILDVNIAVNPVSESDRPAGDEKATKDYKILLNLAQKDDSISQELIGTWSAKLSKDFEREHEMMVSAGLLAKLLREWLAKGDKDAAPAPSLDIGEKNEMEIDTDSDGGFEKTGRKEMYEQRAEFEELVFSPNDTDTVEMEAYLTKLFQGTAEEKDATKAMRKACKKWGDKFCTVEEEEVKRAIKQLLKADLLSNEKNATLKEFLTNPIILKEFTDVIKIFFSSIDQWTWSEEGVPIEMRRQLNGKYRVYMDEELVQAVFLQCIGVQWAEQFFTLFKHHFMDDDLWESESGKLTEPQLIRRKCFLNETEMQNTDLKTVAAKRKDLQQEQYILSQLRQTYDVNSANFYDDTDHVSEPGQTKVVPGLKQQLFHLLTAEMLLNTTLHEQHCILRSDFEWFGPNLSHNGMLTTLKFFGVPEKWLKFFKTFLQAPLKFTHDGENAQVRVRQRGVPISHALSTVFGEVMMFCMDYAVSRTGSFLYRIHDDLWLWNSDARKVAAAWEAMTGYARVFGLKFNEEKTGSMVIGAEKPPGLPEGKIRWGFLVLESSGRFVIDQASVDLHTKELQLQLKACDGIFAWVQAYNRYMRFFVNNFANIAPCYGRQHIYQIEDTLHNIHKVLFPEHDGSVTSYLAAEIEKRFGVKDIPTGWFFWPTRMGGLEVHNSFIRLSCARNSKDIPEKADEKFCQLRDEHDIEVYERKKKEWNSTGRYRRLEYPASAHISATEPFFSFEEYCLGRESSDYRWGSVFCRSMQQEINTPLPSNQSKQKSVEGYRALLQMSESSYWSWVIGIWGDGVEERWGSYRIVKEELLPLGMVDVYKSARIRWEQ